MLERSRVGPGRILLCCYGVFVLAAGARSAVQLGTHAARAPLAYGLSALAAVVYFVGLILLAAIEGGRRQCRTAAIACCTAEFVGVVLVGIASTIRPGAFPDATVWSHFGSGYGYVPAVLPVLAMAWLFRGARDRTAAAT